MRQSLVVLFFFASFDAQFVEYHGAVVGKGRKSGHENAFFAGAGFDAEYHRLIAWITFAFVTIDMFNLKIMRAVYNAFFLRIEIYGESFEPILLKPRDCGVMIHLTFHDGVF
jgi:hypothetical protein